MSQYVEAPCRTFEAGAAISAFLRVKLSAGVLAAAGAADVEIGTIDDPVLAAGDQVAVRLASAQGTQKMVASGAITSGARVYAAASGKIAATANGNFIGYALDAASANNDVIEVLYLPNRTDGMTRTVEAHTADDTLTVAESGSVHTTVGAAGTVVLTLPPAVVGLEYLFRVGAAQELRLDPDGTEVISLPSTGVPGAAGKYLTANADGETVHLVCTKAGQWNVMGYTGTWTAEA